MAGGDGDPFAITETDIPIAPGTAAVDVGSAYADFLVRFGRLEDELATERRAAVAGERRLLGELVVVAEALDVVVAAGPQAAAAAARKLLLRTLSRRGVERLELVGTLADPELVDIDSSEPDAAYPDETVVREIVTAYRWNGAVLRRGVVVVSYRPVT